MEEQSKKKKRKWVRKWGRLIVAIASSILLLNKPVFNFMEENGLEHVRTSVMTMHRFEVHLTNIATGIDKLMGAMSVNGLFYSALSILIGCVLCTIFYEEPLFCVITSTVTACLAGGYYLFMIYYALELEQKFYLSFYPNLIALLPTLILLIMLSIRKEMVRK